MITKNRTLDALMNVPLRKKDFYQILEQYEPLKFEMMENASWATYTRAMNYALRTRSRFFLVFQYILEHFTLNSATFVDLGPYPGTFLRLLHCLVPSECLRLYGVGLNASDTFVTLMKKECGASILEVNLDPTNPDLISRNFSSSVALEDNTVDYIHAGEVIEHLTNPAWMLQESYRLLKPGGCIIITTPNVTRIGNVFKLLSGRSNYDRLSPIGSQDSHDEWRSHFHEYELIELVNLLFKQGFLITHRAHYNNCNTEFVVKGWKQRIIDLAKVPFYLVPHLRNNLFLVATKPLPPS